MKVKVLFFGATADLTRKRQAEIEITEDAVAANVLEQIFAEFPSLVKHHDKKSLLFSINQEYSSGDEKIKEGDELAIFTAVSGG
ncbi:MAG: MoaD/ThiS family protein [Pyrinomonadaceae bacterium]|nr:MoaD/ThiS family protein [Pyrinomonadaceae bacterium]